MKDDTDSKGKPFPKFYTDEEAKHFIDTADLSEYDFSQLKPMKFVLRRKDEPTPTPEEGTPTKAS